MQVIDVSGMSETEAEATLNRLYRSHHDLFRGSITSPSDLYFRLVEAHIDLSKVPKSEEALRPVDSDLWLEARMLRMKRQQLIAIFMDIMIDNWRHLALFADNGSFFFVSKHSTKTFIDLPMNEQFFRSVAFLPNLGKREEEAIDKVIEGMGLKEDFKGSWLSRVNGAFWADVVNVRSYDASNTLKVLFNRLHASEIVGVLNSITSTELKKEFLVLCLKLENINAVAWDLLVHDRKIPVRGSPYINKRTRPLVERVPSIKNKFCFIWSA